MCQDGTRLRGPSGRVDCLGNRWSGAVPLWARTVRTPGEGIGVQSIPVCLLVAREPISTIVDLSGTGLLHYGGIGAVDGKNCSLRRRTSSARAFMVGS